MNGLVREQIDGGCVRLIEIAKQWQLAGHDIHLMGSEQAGLSCEHWGLTPTRHITRWRVGEGRWWIVLHSIAVCLFFPLSLWRLHPDLIVTAHDQPYDVLPGVMLKLQRWRRVRLAVVVHLIPLWRFWRRQGPRWYNALAFLIAQRLALLLAALFANRTLAVSRATARQLRSNGFPMRCVTAVACGVDLAAIGAVTHRSDVPRYDTVSVGRIAASKGVFELIDAWELVVARKPDAKLAVIGDGPDRQAVWERVRRRGLARNVDICWARLAPPISSYASVPAVYSRSLRMRKTGQSRLAKPWRSASRWSRMTWRSLRRSGAMRTAPFVRVTSRRLLALFCPSWTTSPAVASLPGEAWPV